MQMTPFATVTSVALLATPYALASQAGDAPGAGAPPTTSVQASQNIHITRGGSQPRKGPAEDFTGSARIDPLFQANDPSRTSGAYVTFEPGARTEWHTHPLGQIQEHSNGKVVEWLEKVSDQYGGAANSGKEKQDVR
jgi:hypothetical protein